MEKDQHFAAMQPPLNLSTRNWSDAEEELTNLMS